MRAHALACRWFWSFQDAMKNWRNVKNSRSCSIYLLLALMSLALATASAQITPSDDAYILTTTPASNFGTSGVLDLQSGKATTFVRFDLSSIPSGYTDANITKATLKLYVNTATTAGSFNVDYVLGPWSEKTITGNLEPAIGSTIASGVNVTTASKGDYILIDVTAALNAWLDGTQANDGIALVANSPLVASFTSKENTATSHAPELDIVFTATGPQGPPGLQGPVGPQGPQGIAGTNGTGFNFTGAFSNSTAYNVNDVVTYNGSSYVAIVANQGAGTPDTNPTDWTVMAQQGAAGAQGLQGPQGTTGATGSQGPMGLQGPQGPPGVPPPNVAVTNAPNTFTASQTIGGNLIVTGSGNGVQFADGTVQTTAATTLFGEVQIAE